MSRIATKPSAAWTWSPSWTSRQKRQSRSGGNGEHPLVPDTDRSGADEAADRAVHEPGRVVVRIPAPGPVDEHPIDASDPRVPAAPRELVRQRTKPGATLALDADRNGVVARRPRSGPRRVGKHVRSGYSDPLD